MSFLGSQACVSCRCAPTLWTALERQNIDTGPWSHATHTANNQKSTSRDRPQFGLNFGGRHIASRISCRNKVKILPVVVFRWFEPWKSPIGIKRQNVWMQVFYLFNFSHVWFFYSLSGCSWCTKCQKNKFMFLRVCMGKKNNMADMVKFGYGCINGFIAWKQLISAEGNIMRKCR